MSPGWAGRAGVRQVGPLAVAVLLLVPALAGCAGSGPGSAGPAAAGTVPTRACLSAAASRPATTGGPSGSPAGPSGSVAGPSGAATNPAPVPARLPDLTLSCLDSTQTVALARLDRPVIINLWASWCQPCRTEMPVLAAYATAHTGQVTVLGVDTGDTVAAARPQLAARGVTYPVLVDEHRALLAALGRAALPVTVFADATGAVRYVHDRGALDGASLAELAHQYLGVVP